VSEEESQVTTNAEDAATKVAPSEDGSEGAQIILDPSSDGGRVLQASSAFRTLGIIDPNEDPFLNLQQNGQQSGGQQRSSEDKNPKFRQSQPTPRLLITERRESIRGQEKNEQQQNNKNEKLNIRHGNQPQSQPNSHLRNAERRVGSRDSSRASKSARLPAPCFPTKPRTWAEPEGLVTTRQSIQRAIYANIEANKEKLIKGRDEDVDIIIYVSN